jgi:CrcB protein
MRLVAIAIGGALGAALRYLLSGWVQSISGPQFPWGTLAVNALGSLLLGVFMAASLSHAGGDAWGRHFWAIGLIGGFTTFSAFSYETMALFEVGDWWGAVANVLLNVGLGIGAVLVGLRLGEAW